MFCPFKELYTEVGEDGECDEVDCRGRKRYAPKEDAKR